MKIILLLVVLLVGCGEQAVNHEPSKTETKYFTVEVIYHSQETFTYEASNTEYSMLIESYGFVISKDGKFLASHPVENIQTIITK